MSKKPYVIGKGGTFLHTVVQQATMGDPHPAAQDRRRSAGMYPSMASAFVKPFSSAPTILVGPCMRESWYKLRHVPRSDESDSPRMARIRRMGDMIADHFVYDMAKRAGVYVADEVSFFDDELRLSGRYDLMVRLPTMELMGSDVKSISVWMETPHIRSGKNGFVFTEPRWKDVAQIMVYMAHYWTHGVRYWSLYYVSRHMDDNEFVFEWVNPPGSFEEPIGPDCYLRCYSSVDQHEIEMPWLRWGEISARYRTLLRHLQDKTTPPREGYLQMPNSMLYGFAKEFERRVGSFKSREANPDYGSQLIPLNKGEAETVLRRAKPLEEKAAAAGEELTAGALDEHPEPLLENKGDGVCTYCEFKTLCHTGVQTNEAEVQRRLSEPIAPSLPTRVQPPKAPPPVPRPAPFTLK